MPAHKHPGDDDQIDTTALPSTKAFGPRFDDTEDLSTVRRDLPPDVAVAAPPPAPSPPSPGPGRDGRDSQRNLAPNAPRVPNAGRPGRDGRDGRDGQRNVAPSAPKPPPPSTPNLPSAPRGVTPPPSVMIGNMPPDEGDIVDESMVEDDASGYQGYGLESPEDEGGTPSQQIGGLFVTNFHFRRSRTYAFVVDNLGRPIEIGSGRYARVFLGQERWSESLTELQRLVVIKMMHRRIAEDDANRFRIEKELLERVQGHPGIVEVLGSGTCTDPRVPAAIRELCSGDFMILEKLDMNLEERLKGTRDPQAREDLLAFDMHDRLLRVLEYMIPIASAVEYAHLVRNVCHRDINPANILIRLADPKLAGSKMQVRLADFGVAKAQDQAGVTRFAYGVPGTMYFQSPEQETNILELLVSVQQGSAEVEYFEDFYIDVAKNDTFAIFNRREEYGVLYTDRARRRIVLSTPYRERTESNVRAHVQKAVGRPADIYALGALFYYLITGAYGNPKTLYDTFHKFIEYERPDESNTIAAYLRHEYATIESLRSAKSPPQGTAQIPLADRFFGYKHYADGNGELIHFAVMMIIARAMMRNKPDSYCQAHEIETAGISLMVRDLANLYSLYGLGDTIPAQLPDHRIRQRLNQGGKTTDVLRRIYDDILSVFGSKRR